MSSASSSLTVFQEVELPVPPGLFYNNLVVHRSGDYVSYAAPTAIVSVRTATGTPVFRPLQLSSGTHVEFLASVVDPSIENIFLVAALSDRTAVVVVNGQQTNSINAKGPTEIYTCVAAARAVTSETVVLALGGSEGTIETLRYTLEGRSTTAAEVSLPVQAHEHRSISALDVEATVSSANDVVVATEMVSGDTAGHVVLWKSGSPVVCVPPPDTSDAVTAAKLLPNTSRVAVAFGGGQIKVLERGSGAAVIVIQAHARWINALSYHPVRQLLVSAAEDGQIYVWNVAAPDPHGVCVAHGSVPNELLTGVVMMGTNNVVAQISYDTVKLRLMSFS